MFNHSNEDLKTTLKKPFWMKRISIIAILVTISSFAPAQIHSKYQENISVTYEELLSAYQLLSDEHESASLMSYGPTDSGRSLHLFVISGDGDFSPLSLREKNRRIVMINNGIHPGEPCGIDASLKLADDILNERYEFPGMLENTVVCIVPVFNVGGMLNRSPFHRANQNGPVEHGFRANAQNQDLNRDFIKMDAMNTWSFVRIFREWDPDVFIDTHATNGADYPYVMTIIPTRHEKLHPELGEFFRNKMTPHLFSVLLGTPYEITPYVQTRRGNIVNGIVGFMDSPRYTTGYSSLFNTLGFITEAHMLKPFSDRVLATWNFIYETLKFTNEHAEEIGELRKNAKKEILNKKDYVVQWRLDTTKADSFLFKGYEQGMITGRVTGLQRIIYDQSRSYSKKIPYFNDYTPSLSVEKPDYYIIPQAWREVVNRLDNNGVAMKRFLKDTTLFAEVYYIESYNTSSRPNNGRFSHSNISVRKELQPISILQGDVLIETIQETNHLIVQTLEPQAADSYFSWNFFDAILSRKEYFSPWLFEDYAEEFLASNPEIREDFENRRKNDESFASSAYAQLNFIYERSPFAEISYLRVPVYRLNHKNKLPVE